MEKEYPILHGWSSGSARYPLLRLGLAANALEWSGLSWDHYTPGLLLSAWHWLADGSMPHSNPSPTLRPRMAVPGLEASWN